MAHASTNAYDDGLDAGIQHERRLWREAVIDLLAILDSPHTSVSTRHETGSQYKQAKERLRRILLVTADTNPKPEPTLEQRVAALEAGLGSQLNQLGHLVGDGLVKFHERLDRIEQRSMKPQAQSKE